MEQGEITSVYYDKGAVYCDVRAFRSEVPYEKLPVVRPHAGSIQMPEQGWTALIHQLDDGTRVIKNFISREKERPKSLSEGDFSLQVDEDTQFALTENDDGTYDITVSASGDVNISATGDVNISAEKDVNISAEGSVFLQEIEWLTHGHAYDWTDPGGSGVTDGPQ